MSNQPDYYYDRREDSTAERLWKHLRKTYRIGFTVSEIYEIMDICALEKDEALNKALRERDEAIHSSKTWELMHAKRHEECEALATKLNSVTAERDKAQQYQSLCRAQF